MARYRTKPCEIEAVQWTGDNIMEIRKFAEHKVRFHKYLFIDTLEGRMRAEVGDYIIKGLRGEFYPCKPDVFEKKYDLIC